MKFSENWIRKWINPNVNNNVLCDQISNAGIEVKNVKKNPLIFTSVFVGHIVQCSNIKEKKIKFVQVDIGNKHLLNIVCSAENCRNNIKVAVAVKGAVLPRNVRIKKKFFQNLLSEGILCSFFDLGMFPSDSIIEFPENTEIGINVYDYLSLKDNVIQVDVTPNRPDGLSVLGIARNIAAMNNIKIPDLKNITVLKNIKNTFNVSILARKACVNYFHRIIQNVNLHVETPIWMKQRLFFSDIMPDDIISDIINYVLIEIGQPLNILDADQIYGNDIFVRMSIPGEEISSKNDSKILLNKNIFVISDQKKILFAPGNINNKTLDVQNTTKNIFLSSFLIDPKYIKNLFQKINKNKILEYYQYGIDPSLQRYSIEYATHLITKICGGIPSDIIEEKNNFLIKNKKIIQLNLKKFQKITGFSVDTSTISNILEKLYYEFIFHGKYWNVLAPSWRFDILNEEDVISDILRVYGYKNILLEPLSNYFNVIKRNDLIDILIKNFSLILSNRGYYEVITYSFVDPKIQNFIFPDKKTLLISNPISKNMSSMRISLWPGLLHSLSYNINRQKQNIRFFESGMCFFPDKSENLGVQQKFFLSGIISGDFTKEIWNIKKRKVDFYDLKGDVESILESLYELKNVEFRRTVINGLHPEQSAEIYLEKNLIGKIGSIHPLLEDKLNIKYPTFLFELILNNFPVIKNITVRKISKLPISRRDLSLFIDDSIPVSDVIDVCNQCFPNKTIEINVFDVYSCHNLSCKKSIGISFFFQDMKKTFEENEINYMMNYYIETLEKNFNIILRK